MKKRRMSASTDSFLREMQTTFMDIEAHKVRLLDDMEKRERRFLGKIESLEDDKIFCENQNKIFTSYGSLLKTEVELLKLQRTLVSAKTKQEDAPSEDKINAFDMSKIREEFQKLKKDGV